MKIKSVVKVMNFHALLRVDKSRRQAEKYREMENQLTDMISVIMNNRNFLLDKKITKPDPTKPPLEIYIGSDLGFCGSVNSSVAKQMKSVSEAEKIVIGKKLALKNIGGNSLMQFNREDYSDYANQIRKLLEDAILKKQYSSVSIIYNHYYNVSKIELRRKMIYPLEIPLESNPRTLNDYEIESDNGNLLESIIIQYLDYEIRIAWINAFASENVTRQSATQESLKKIDEIEEEEVRIERKEKKMKSFRKVLDAFVNQKGAGGAA